MSLTNLRCKDSGKESCVLCTSTRFYLRYRFTVEQNVSVYLSQTEIKLTCGGSAKLKDKTVHCSSEMLLVLFKITKLDTRYFPLLTQTLYERCDRLRPTLFRLASDTMDDDAALTQILEANDELTLVLKAYKERVGRRESNGGRERIQSEDEMDAKSKGGSFFLLAVFVSSL